tara:strand:+ start:1439 stop:1657 length:219 start_codon:yes stop_codon:yes gene_type:complete
MAEADPKIAGSIDVLIDYKKGGLTLAQAVDRFRKLTGLTPDVAEKFIRGLGRDNVVSLSAKKSVLESESATE